MAGKFLKVITICSLIAFSSEALADAGYGSVEPYKAAPVLSTPDFQKIAPQEENETELTSKLFSLGRSIGASYYYLMDLCDKSKQNSFKNIKKEYNETFQNLNIIDIILDDLNLNSTAKQDLNKIRLNFYNALSDQDLNEAKLDAVRDMFITFYENISNEVSQNYMSKGNWMLTLGFYTSFQLESLNSDREDKILLSGFEKIMSRRSAIVPQNVYESLINIYKLDKPYITDVDLAELKKSLINVIEYFTNISEAKPLINEIKELTGEWQGILVNPNNNKYDIRLNVRENLSAIMDINGIAKSIEISNIKIIDDYFTFMFKPFGSEKLYLKFNAQLSESVFTGEITDVKGEKGYWVLARSNNSQLNETRLDEITSYIQQIEKRLKSKIKPVNQITEVEPQAVEEKKIITLQEKEEQELKQEASSELEELEALEPMYIEEKPALITKEISSETKKKVIKQEKKEDFFKKLKSLFKRLFSFM